MFRFEEVPSWTTPAVLAEVSAAHPDRTFVIAEDGELRYGEMAELVANVAVGFAARGLAPGERVGVLLTNGIRWCASYLAAHAAGLTVVPLNTWYRSDELRVVAERAELRAVITQDRIFGRNGRDLVSGVAAAGTPILTWNRGTATPDGIPEVTVADPLAALRAAPTIEAADALVLFTSGSTAEPKAVRLTQGGVVRTAHAIGERQGVTGSDRLWFGSPLFFVYGCSNALPNALTHAATLCVQEKFDAAAALAFIERHRCTVYYGIGPITRSLAAHPDLAARDISRLRTGTANATPEDLRLAIEVLGVREVCNAYGLTEGHGHSTITHHTDPPQLRMLSQGTALPTQELRIVVDGAPVGPGEPGEIQIRGLISPGYLDDGDRTAQGFAADGWFRTGDLGKLDVDGRLTYLGRSHELMKVNGINVSPLEIERVLVEHDDVDQAFVFGLPTPEGDETVACVLVSTAAHDDLADRVRTWLRTRIAGYKVPSTIKVTTADQLPLTATGKVSKRSMKEQLSG
ncbi:class I adenylate-forming enzyme family protein [Amycolatopsis carbonis]|uniref:Class I adenylate-forming enzyme family protein n=1 Tax=Amycolatopsis carbonis TaxID=715471 RepID=A0A9Y2I9T7_9PSEU|nr:class I adenylate-forming enzyme family protein [Amycolatopsis sp. 2-15]WIX75649.1 class I adenylate-forming enzyme family protein [Amycolatopsis sp. 2-15]